MPHMAYIKKKIGQSYLIWLQKSNKYMLMNEPAWFVFSQSAKGYKAPCIALRCETRYGLGNTESLNFVNDIRIQVEQMNHSAPIKLNADPSAALTNYRFLPYSTHQYCFGISLLTFSFATPDFESYLHPLISHLETTNTKEEAFVFELFEHENQVVFRTNGEVKGAWSRDESHLAKGRIFMNLINLMYDKKDDFWLMTVHASAITNGQKTILFSARPGGGKTTMAAMLQHAGYEMVSDDFVPIDRHTFSAWPVPLAMSVKQESMGLISAIYPEIEDRAVNQISPQKSVRYLFPHIHEECYLKPLPVKEFIFIHYNPQVSFQWEKIDAGKAVKLLLEQCWISPSTHTADILMEQLSHWTFYELTYSDNEKALNILKNLFSHDI